MFGLFPFPGMIAYGSVAQTDLVGSDSSMPSARIEEFASSERPSDSVLTSNILPALDKKSSELPLLNSSPESESFTGSNEPESTPPCSRALTEELNLSSNKLRQRKEHKKSRNGCFNCKKRKIKCPEDQPACRNCTRVNVICKYPHVKVIQAVQRPTLERNNLQSTPTVFDATDMRLFHHFVVNAYPHLPLGNDNVWVREVASFAHAHDFLMQAMLALAASHLTMTSTSQLNSEALFHRLHAIRGLNNALSRPPKTAEESDAILATCWTLAFQTSHMGESVEEFLTIWRGCELIVDQGWTSKFGTAFQNLGIDGQSEVMLPRLETLPLVDQDLVAEARASFEKLGDLCMAATEEAVLEHMVDMVRALSVSSLEAYVKFKELQNYMGNSISHSAFQEFIDPSNAIAQLLLAHYIALRVLFAPIKSCEWVGRNMGHPNRKTIFRMDNIWNNVPKGMRTYLEWPMLATGYIEGYPPYIDRHLGYRAL